MNVTLPEKVTSPNRSMPEFTKRFLTTALTKSLKHESRTRLGRLLKLQKSRKLRLKLPISRDEFDKLNQRVPTLEEAVLALLTADPQVAYTAVEIALKLNPYSSLHDPYAHEVTSTLQNLLTRKAAVAKWRQTDSGQEYFFTIP